MKIGTILLPLLLFVFTFFVYYYVGTKGEFRIRQDLDHYNALALSFREGHLDIKNPVIKDELSFYHGKWYPYYGPLPALLIGFLQVITRRIFISTVYPNIFVASLNVVLVYFLFKRLKKEFFPQEKYFFPLIFTLALAFGTVHFWLGSRSGVWFTVQIYAFLVSILGFFFLVKKKRRFHNYFFSIFFFSLGLFTRPNTIILLTFPLLLFFFDYLRRQRFKEFMRRLLIAFSPFLFLFILWGTYNFLRFDNPWQTGVDYQKHHYHFEGLYISRGGWFSLKNIPYNLWFMTLEVPRLTYDGVTQSLNLTVNNEGNSIFFLSPFLLTIFLARPKRPLVFSLWATLIITLLPILTLSGTGWQQFGYRYTLDVTVILMLLSIFGIKGRVNLLYVLLLIFSIFIQTMGNMVT